MDTKIENHGIIPDPRPLEEKLRDYVAGAETGIAFEVRFPDASSFNVMPIGERQYMPNRYDTMNCTNFSSGHCIEAQIIWLWVNNKLSKEAMDFFRQYMLDPNDIRTFRISKRAAAILSGTTKQGNYFHKVWDTWHKVGLIPDSMLPFGGNTWEEYSNPSLITQAMLDMGKKSLEYIDIAYEILGGYDQNGGFSKVELDVSLKALKQAPLNIGIPIPCYHAITQYDTTLQDYGALDHYEPFIRRNNANDVPVYCAFKGVVNVKTATPTPAPFTYTFTMPLVYGAPASNEVMMLQKALQSLKSSTTGKPYMKSEVFGPFGPQTKIALGLFQTEHHIKDPNGQGTNFGPKTRAAMNLALLSNGK